MYTYLEFQYPNKRVILPDEAEYCFLADMAVEFQYPNKRVILPDPTNGTGTESKRPQGFQYPNKRVILPDFMGNPKPRAQTEIKFQYPNKRVILPDTVCVISCLASNYKAVCDSGHFDIQNPPKNGKLLSILYS